MIEAGGKTIEVYRVRTIAITRHGRHDRKASISHGIHSMIGIPRPHEQ
jgi:hypothetical protein